MMAAVIAIALIVVMTAIAPDHPGVELVLWGPARETALLLGAAVLFHRVALLSTHHRDSGRVAGILIIGSAFAAAHVLQSGSDALASAPLAFLLTAGAFSAVSAPTLGRQVFAVFALWLSHAGYNAFVIGAQLR